MFFILNRFGKNQNSTFELGFSEEILDIKISFSLNTENKLEQSLMVVTSLYRVNKTLKFAQFSCNYFHLIQPPINNCEFRAYRIQQNHLHENFPKQQAFLHIGSFNFHNGTLVHLQLIETTAIVCRLNAFHCSCVHVQAFLFTRNHTVRKFINTRRIEVSGRFVW